MRRGDGRVALSGAYKATRGNADDAKLYERHQRWLEQWTQVEL